MPLNKAEFALWFCNYIPLSALASNGGKEKSGHAKKKACFEHRQTNVPISNISNQQLKCP